MNIFKITVLNSILFIFLMNSSSVSAQLKVNSSGNIELGSTTNTIGTSNNVPITFKINGVLAGFTGSSSNSNVSFGYSTLRTSGGYDNTAIGFSALANTTGGENTAVGKSALYSNVTGIYNTAVGCGALYLNKGNSNTANGSNALYSNSSGSSNTAVGTCALQSITGASYNTAVGHLSLGSSTSGNNNTAIGYCAGYDNPNNLSNTTAIGYYATATANNQVRIGNSSITSIGGYAACSNISDGRAKRNIKSNVPGLVFINSLQPVTYNIDLGAVDKLLGIDSAKKDELEKDMSKELKDAMEKSRNAKEAVVQTGFVAQDVEKAAKNIGYDFSGVDVDESGVYAIRYSEFVVPLVKAVQELSEQNNKLQEQVNELTGLVNKLLGKEENASTFRSENSGSSTTGLAEPATKGASLEQNTPNPFNQSTVVRYTLPQTYNSAQVIIINASGSVVRQIPLSTGTNSITIEGSSLQAGIYLYSLICDGNIIDTKRMVLTK